MWLSLGKSGNKYLEYSRKNDLYGLSLCLQLLWIKWDLGVAGFINMRINYI